MKVLTALISIFCFFNMAKADMSDPKTVSYVDLNKYQGLWYEIASFPQSFQKDCTATSAFYEIKKNGKVSVLNTCRIKDPINGKLKKAKGTAKVVDKTTNAKLKVTFFWPFYGDYWIFELGQNYEYAVVGSPDRESLWVLSRDPIMESTLYEELKHKMWEQGFEVERLVPTIR